MIKIFIFSFFTTHLYVLYGEILNKFLFKNHNLSNTNQIIKNFFFGIYLLSIISLLIHFFLPLNKLVNTFILLLPYIFLLYFKFNFFNKKILKFCTIISIFSVFLIVYSNINRPDAALYHLPFTSYLNEHKIIFGINNLHFRFGFTSIIQYLSAINNNLFFNNNGIIIPLSVICLFFTLFFFRNCLIGIKKKKFDEKFIFSFLIIIFITFKINRYSGFGNDAIAHLSFFYLLYIFIKYFFKRSIYKNLYIILAISIFTFLNKNTYILALIIPFTLIVISKLKNYKNLINYKNIFVISLLLLWLIKNLIISGCLIYPISFTCVEKFSWTDKNDTIERSISTEAWSKGWPDRDKNIIINEKKFIKEFNWLKTWKKKNLKKIINILSSYIFILIIAYLCLRSSNKKFKNKKLFIFLLIYLFFCNLLFLFKFPTFRYGSSYTISLIVIIFIFLKNNFNYKKTFLIINILVYLLPLIYIGKQLFRITTGKKNYINEPWPNIYSLDNSKIFDKKIIFSKERLNIYYSDYECGYSKSICINYKIRNNIKIITKNSYTGVVKKN